MHQSELKNASDLVTVFCIFSLNWEKNDFHKAFKNTSQGWEYFWDRFSGYAEHQMDTFFYNIDFKHREMLLDYIFHVKHKKDLEGIEKSRGLAMYISKQAEKQSKGDFEGKSKSELQVLLDEAIEKQDFEQAALLRDEIKKLEQD